ncbi:two component system response regulator [Candidatus Curculioniphilus buchneri]|uniref:two component system response regulator n=1 Tax=Candidatus Curculioniphilus buchneri TaxID=690594 RepID=UPI00376F10A9
MNQYNILLVDDHELIINGIISVLEPYKRFKVVAYTDDGLSAYSMCRINEPNILVLDLGLPGINGLDLIPKFCTRWPDMAILAYTAYTEEYMAIRTLSAGALGYVLKNSSQQIFIAAIHTIAINKYYIDPALNSEIIHASLNVNTEDKGPLTSRERQILKLIADGYTNRLIAKKLYISVKTVETHRLNIMRKLKVHKVTELLNCSRRLGLIN